MPSLQSLLFAGLVASGTLACAIPDGRRPVEAGFWMDRVSYDLAGHGGPLTVDELGVVERAALEEVRRAFTGIALQFSHRRNARYTVSVVQHLYDLRLRSTHEVYGNARAIPGFGGRGAVNFFAVASSAAAYAPENASRGDVIAAVGRGVGRVAIHEFIHLFLPQAPIDGIDDALSYEYGHGGRREQYYGELRWGFAKGALLRKFSSK